MILTKESHYHLLFHFQMRTKEGTHSLGGNMDSIFGPALSILLVVWPLIFLLVALTLFVNWLNSARTKGKIGESLVRGAIRMGLNSKVYLDLHDITLPTEDGSTQIDHIVVSRYGIFVIETKNYKGWIFGDAKSKQWTQTIYKKKHRFQNPLHQNYKHIKTLSELTTIPMEYFHTVIVFMGEAEFKTELPPSICRQGGFISYIKSFTKDIILDEQVTEIAEVFGEWSLEKGRATDRAHVEHLREKHAAQ